MRKIFSNFVCFSKSPNFTMSPSGFSDFATALFNLISIFLGANLNSTNLSGQTALHSAAETGQITVVQFLIEEKVDPFKTDVFKLKAIDIAKMLKRTELLCPLKYMKK